MSVGLVMQSEEPYLAPLTQISDQFQANFLMFVPALSLKVSPVTCSTLAPVVFALSAAALAD